VDGELQSVVKRVFSRARNSSADRVAAKAKLEVRLVS